MSEIESSEKVVTTPKLDLEIAPFMENYKKKRKTTKRRVVTTEPRWFIRHTRARGHEYQQLARHIYRNQRRVMQIARVIWPEQEVETRCSHSTT